MRSRIEVTKDEAAELNAKKRNVKFHAFIHTFIHFPTRFLPQQTANKLYIFIVTIVLEAHSKH